MLRGCPISRKIKNHTTVFQSSTEIEYHAMAMTTSELVWLRSLLTAFGVHLRQPIELHCHNKSTLHISTNLVFHERTKHNEIDCHFVWECIQSGDLINVHVPTKLQLADTFTKALICDRFHFLLPKLDIHDLHAPT